MTTPATDIIAKLEAYIAENCSRVDVDARYDEMLDECYDLSSVGGPFSSMFASTVLKEVDPTAYRCRKVDFEDSEGFVEIGGEYYEGSEVDGAREDFQSGLEDELSELEDERDELEEEETNERLEIEGRITAKEAEIAAVSAHSF